MPSASLPERGSPAPAPFVCGVDAGGTKTDCATCAADGTVLARWIAGPAAMNGRPDFTEAVVEALDRCRQAAGVPADQVHVVVVGMAGIDTDDGRDRATAALAAKLGVADLVVDNDASIALEAATSQRPAAVIMAGTGSIGYGEDATGRSHRVGGWGHLLGDEGSGYAIAVAALGAVLQAADLRGADTALIDRARHHFSLDDPRELIDLTERFAVEPGIAAGFAPEVIRLGEAGDETAATIVRDAAGHLVDQACGLIDALGIDGDGVVALGGGLLVNSAYYADMVSAGIRAARPGVEIRGFELPPVAGALLKGLVRLDVDRDADALRRRVTEGLNDESRHQEQTRA